MSVHLDYDWDLEIKYDPKELGEPYELYFFIDSAPSSPSDWRTSPSRLFEPISSHAHSTTTEYRSLNGYLEQRCKGKLEDADVVPYLREHLLWVVKKRYHDEKVDDSKLKSLKVSVVGPDGTITLSDETSRE